MRTPLLILAAIALMTAPVALAAHGDRPVVAHTTYEEAVHNSGPVGLAWTCPIGDISEDTPVGDLGCDPTGTAADGSLDIGGAVVRMDSDPRLDDVSTLQASIIDDVWGPGVVAGSLCVDLNDNGVCEPDDDEPRTTFCGDSPVLEFPAGAWGRAAVFVYGAYRSVMFGCDATQAPVATSGGVLDPSGGVFYTFD